jgi:hypothetical protein
VGIWDQLNTKTIADNAGTAIQVQSNPVHLQEQNRQELSDIKLINDATMRSGQFIPATGNIDEITLTDSESGVKTVLVSCQKGEVKQVNVVGGIRSGGSADVTYQMYMRQEGKTDLSWFFYRSSDSGILFTGDANYPDYPVFVDENVSLVVEATGSDFTSVIWQAHTFRVR